MTPSKHSSSRQACALLELSRREQAPYDVARAAEKCLPPLLRPGQVLEALVFRCGIRELITAIPPVYFLATRLLPNAGAGPTFLISPLLALMRDQAAAAERVGVRATSINSTNVRDRRAVEDQIAGGGACAPGRSWWRTWR
jgi:hypothetical protein